jgi:hypothetical protein
MFVSFDYAAMASIYICQNTPPHTLIQSIVHILQAILHHLPTASPCPAPSSAPTP